MHQLTCCGFPEQFAIEGPGLHVQAALVMTYIDAGKLERLIIHEQGDELAVRHVQYCLADPGETVGFFAVKYGPRLIKPIDESAALHTGRYLFRTAAHAEITVAQRENGFHLRHKF